MAENPSYDFASRDYANIRQDLMARASRAVPEWTDRDPSDFATAMVELWAYMGDIFHFYIDQAAQEAFVNTATKRDSVMALANLFDYTPRFRYPAVGTVDILNNTDTEIALPQYTKFSGSYNDTFYTFYSTSAASIPAYTTISVELLEGRVIENELLTSSSNGSIGQRYTLSDTDAIPASVRVFVSDQGTSASSATEWEQVEHVNTVTINRAAFSVYPSSTGEVEVAFGNRLSGRIPPSGSTITSTYSVCSGAAGNVPEETVTSFYSNAPLGLAVGYSSSFTGGSDAESVDSIKKSLKSTIRTQERVVTLQDFKDYALLVTGVYKAVASYTSGSVTIYPFPYIDTYTSYASASASVSTAVQAEILSTIQPKALLGVTVTVAPSVTIRRAVLSINLYVNEKYRNSLVQKAVENALDGLFELSNLDFGKDIKAAEIYRTCMLVEGVDYIVLNSLNIYSGTSGTTAASVGPTNFLRKGSYTIAASGGMV